MNTLKPIRQLPELEEHQEWSCAGGCDHIEPKLHKNIYAESWDENGVKIRELSEHYYTCRNEHLLAVWDTLLGEYDDLPPAVYQQRENKYGLTLDVIQKMRKALDEEVAKYTGIDLEFLKLARVSFEIQYKNGDLFTIDHDILNELEAVIQEEDSELNIICDARKDQNRVSVNIADL